MTWQRERVVGTRGCQKGHPSGLGFLEVLGEVGRGREGSTGRRYLEVLEVVVVVWGSWRLRERWGEVISDHRVPWAAALTVPMGDNQGRCVSGLVCGCDAVLVVMGDESRMQTDAVYIECCCSVYFVI